MRSDIRTGVEVVVLGAAAVDMVARVPSLPAADSIVAASSFAIYPGGANANVCEALAKLGSRVVFLGKVGDDEGGRLLVDSFKKSGVDTRGIKVVTGAHSASCFITVDELGNRTIVGLPGVATLEEPGELDTSLLDGIRILYIGDALPKVACVAAETAHKNGAKVFYGVGGVMASFGLSFLASILKMTDVLVLSRNETLALAGNENLSQAMQILAGLGPEVVITTLGSEGARLFTSGMEEHIAAWQGTAVVDTTGAGDAFIAGLIKGYLEGKNWREAICLGCAVAAIKIGHIGARSGLPSRKQVDDFMERAKK
ncbi:MAG: carbohydrate kinase family protein [Chloroflexi bacterium]|nr:carbohydrate kinase family protein [Chloroflexota bacterium]